MFSVFVHILLNPGATSPFDRFSFQVSTEKKQVTQFKTKENTYQ